MRVAFIGVSHWHAPLYYRPTARLGGVEIVGVSDPDLPAAEIAGRELGTRAFARLGDLLAEAKPEFVFVFGRHCDMPGIASALIDGGIPFLLEKPGGLNAAQVSALRQRAAAKRLHVGTGFNFRVSDVYKRIQALVGGDPMPHASFRFIAGGPYRYREAGCHWMLDPALSGGGCTINLALHFVDMFRSFSGDRPREVTSLMGNFAWNLPVEDYSAILLRGDRSVCTIETGYAFPAQLGVFDLRFSIRTHRHYLVARNDDVLEVYRAADGHVERFYTAMSNAVWYPAFVVETLDRFARGEPPVADLADLEQVMRVVDAAYASNRAGGAAIRLGEPAAGESGG
jgi:predicted dehydrogenase